MSFNNYTGKYLVGRFIKMSYNYYYNIYHEYHKVCWK